MHIHGMMVPIRLVYQVRPNFVGPRIWRPNKNTALPTFGNIQISSQYRSFMKVRPNKAYPLCLYIRTYIDKHIYIPQYVPVYAYMYLQAVDRGCF